MTDAKPLNYSDVTGWRTECFERFGPLLVIPVVDNIYRQCQRFYSGGAVLDFGCGAKQMLKKCLGLSEDGITNGDSYYSMDSDLSGGAAYKFFTDIPEGQRFDYIFANQVLEHMTVVEVYDTLLSMLKILRPGGGLFISVPNSQHPTRYHSDVSHVTNWPMGDLYGLVKHAGFEVEAIMRVNKRPFTKSRIKAWLINTICQELRIDWCDTIIIEARI